MIIGKFVHKQNNDDNINRGQLVDDTWVNPKHNCTPHNNFENGNSWRYRKQLQSKERLGDNPKGCETGCCPWM